MKRLKKVLGVMMSKIIFGRQRIIFVCGMRRSGNHAFINWITNALEEKEVQYQVDKKYRNLSFSESGETAFINEVNDLRTFKYVSLLFRRWIKLQRSKVIIVSAEDVSYDDGRNFWMPCPSERIFIKRSLLNVVSSRLNTLRKNAARGKGISRQTIDARFFKRIRSWHRIDENVQTWEYDQWVTSPSYREQFLKQLDLECDINPSISKEGGGSSFTGRDRVPTADEVVNRYKNFTLPDNILAMLSEPINQKMLSAEELNYLGFSK